MHLNRVIEIIFNSILIVQIALATPYSWSSYHRNYDASLDPIVWSRGFVKDAIRRPRQYRTNTLEHNSLDGGEDELPLQGYDFGGFGKRGSSRDNFGNDYANNWYSNPITYGHNGKYNSMQKKMNRRKKKLNAWQLYGLV